MSTPDTAAGATAVSTNGESLAAPERSSIRGFQVGRLHFKHMQTFAKGGWASNEGANREAVTVFGLFRCYQDNFFQGWRLTVGRHSFWVLV